MNTVPNIDGAKSSEGSTECNTIYKISLAIHGFELPLSTRQHPSKWLEISWNLASHVVFRNHDDVIIWKHFPHYWPFVRGIHRSQWHGALMFSLISTWINGWVNNREAGDLRCLHVHYDIIAMFYEILHHIECSSPYTSILSHLAYSHHYNMSAWVHVKGDHLKHHQWYDWVANWAT